MVTFRESEARCRPVTCSRYQRGAGARYCCAAILSRASRRKSFRELEPRNTVTPLKPEEGAVRRLSGQAANDWFDPHPQRPSGTQADPGNWFEAGPARRHPLPATIRQGPWRMACADGDDRETAFLHLPKEARAWLPKYLHELPVFPNGKHDETGRF